jgi:TonB family protein
MLVSVTKAQTKSCNLYFKIYVYDANSSKNRLEKANLIVKNVKSKQEQSLSLSSTTRGFENLGDGRYQVKIKSPGYKEKTKDLTLECDFADKENVSWQYVYLWKDKTASETDLVAYVVETKSDYNSQSDIKSKNDGLRESGKVTIEIIIDEDGNVISAKALDGKPTLVKASIKAVRQSKFAPTKLAGIPVKVTGTIVYNFVP